MCYTKNGLPREDGTRNKQLKAIHWGKWKGWRFSWQEVTKQWQPTSCCLSIFHFNRQFSCDENFLLPKILVSKELKMNHSCICLGTSFDHTHLISSPDRTTLHLKDCTGYSNLVRDYMPSNHKDSDSSHMWIHLHVTHVNLEERCSNWGKTNYNQQHTKWGPYTAE